MSVAQFAPQERLDAVWDVTMGYVDLPEGAGEVHLLTGRWPAEVHFHVRRFSGSAVLQTASGLMDKDPPDMAEEWLNKRWADKEAELHRFEVSRDAASDEQAPLDDMNESTTRSNAEGSDTQNNNIETPDSSLGTGRWKRYGVSYQRGTSEQLLGGDASKLYDASEFPWMRWCFSGAPLYLGFCFFVVPYVVYVTVISGMSGPICPPNASLFCLL